MLFGLRIEEENVRAGCAGVEWCFVSMSGWVEREEMITGEIG